MRSAVRVLRPGLFPVLVAGVVAGTAACGDPFLPSDYAGPPAAAVSGNVVAFAPTDKLAEFPTLSVEWLGSLEALPPFTMERLHGQRLRFVRSNRIETDWDIDLPVPIERARLERLLPGGRVRLSVGKLVYFDDIVTNGRLDWDCSGSNCDVLKAVSAEYVVFLDSAPTCKKAGQRDRQPLELGFHYYRLHGGVPRELGAGESLNFLITDRKPLEGDPTQDLRTFTHELFRLWSLNSLGDC